MRTFLNILMGLCLADALLCRTFAWMAEMQGRIDVAQLNVEREIAALIALGVALTRR